LRAGVLKDSDDVIGDDLDTLLAIARSAVGQLHAIVREGARGPAAARKIQIQPSEREAPSYERTAANQQQQAADDNRPEQVHSTALPHDPPHLSLSANCEDCWWSIGVVGFTRYSIMRLPEGQWIIKIVKRSFAAFTYACYTKVVHPARLLAVNGV